MPELNYDIHLKPATDFKKSKGEDFAISYLFELLNSTSWKYYDCWSILDKMAGYYKKANQQNKQIIISEFYKLLDQKDSIDYYSKVSSYKRLAGLYEHEKDYELAFQMLSGALSNNHPESSNYLFELSEISLRFAQIVGKGNLSNRENSANYLYWYFVHLFYTTAWYQVLPNDPRTLNWKSRIDPSFPFETKITLQALRTLEKDILADMLAIKFQKIIFVDFVSKIQNQVDQSEMAEHANQFTGDFLNFIGANTKL